MKNRFKDQKEFKLDYMVCEKEDQEKQWSDAIKNIAKNIKQESVAVTLMLQHSKTFHNPKKEKVYLDNIYAEKNIRHFINVLQDNIGMKLFNVFGLQKSGTRWHSHGIIEKPRLFKTKLFKHLILGVWQQTDFGTVGQDSKDFHIEKIFNANGWIQYSTRINTSIERFVPTAGKCWVNVGTE
jgi:hypothetical protein